MPQISGLQRLPYELIAYIVELLAIQDIFYLSLCSKHFQYILREDRFCKPVIMTKGPDTLEGQEAFETGRFSRALRRLAKRHEALSRASPYVVGIVACADSYGLFGGKLCYIIEDRPQRWLRMLDVHGPAIHELVVNIHMLISEAIPRAANCRKYKFKVLYQAAGIVSCLFSFALRETENWLLIIEPQSSKILETFLLASTARLFVRNNDKFLYFGTYSGEGADGNSWLPQPRMYMLNLAGCEMGSTVCFEIFGDYFYGLSNRTLYEAEADDPEWQSNYYCFRFPLGEPNLSKLEVMRNEDSWRRQHAEGPIDDRWGFLSLKKDKTDGNIIILECRKEWLKGRSKSQRTYYTTEVVFREQSVQRDQSRLRTHAIRRDASILFRRPENVHVGDNSSAASLSVRSKTFFSAYIQHCHTFVDLIDDTVTDSTSSIQQLRLRTGHRTLKPGITTGLDEPPSDEPPLQPDIRPCQDNKIFIWPPEQDGSVPNPFLEKVRQLLNVDNYQRCVDATGDEHCVIYATGDGSKGGVKSLVLLSFDPAARFEGMEYGGNLVGQQTSHDSRQGAEPNVNDGKNSSRRLPFSPNVQPSAVDAMGCSRADSLTSKSWAAYQRPMYKDIQQILYFGQHQWRPGGQLP
ncbi:hypothetical protein F5B18DRAFT_669750 [Nemania serpens]|nr:hypothetical protein F5B18DRAFT_669750 [Nemania serpens]